MPSSGGQDAVLAVLVVATPWSLDPGDADRGDVRRQSRRQTGHPGQERSRPRTDWSDDCGRRQPERSRRAPRSQWSVSWRVTASARMSCCVSVAGWSSTPAIPWQKRSSRQPRSVSGGFRSRRRWWKQPDTASPARLIATRWRSVALFLAEHQRLVPSDDVLRARAAARDQATAVIGIDGQVAGLVVFTDPLRRGVRELMHRLGALGVRETVILTVMMRRRWLPSLARRGSPRCAPICSPNGRSRSFDPSWSAIAW